MNRWDETIEERRLRERAEYAEREAEDLRRQREDDLRRSEAEREKRRKAQREEMDYAYRQASSWPEALLKQASLFAQESWDENEETGFFFTDGSEACKRGLELWHEVYATRQGRIDDLKRQIAEIEAGVGREVADRLDAERNTPGWNQVALALRTETDFSAWLNW